MYTLFLELMAMGRRRDDLARAERERLARQIERHNSPRTRGYQRGLARLGAWLVAWGYRLQTRYGQVLVIPATQQQECYAIENHNCS